MTVPMPRVFVKTLGCKVNTFDSQALENQFKERGYQLLAEPEGADITVINTCSVTAIAEKEARYLLRRYYRDQPKAIRVVTGCYAQIDSGTIAKMDEVDFVVPNEVKGELVSLIEAQIASSAGIKGLTNKLPAQVKAVTGNRQGHFKSALTFFDKPLTDRARAFLKVQDGCNGFCAYCQIPLARGMSTSVAPELVLRETAALVAQGIPELVLTGIHIGDYGRDLPGYEPSGEEPFVRLLRGILATPGLKRLRISSLEPSELTPALIAVLAEHQDIFCEHFHLPLQSGSDHILKLMGRQYDRARYYESVALIRSHFPRAHISADIIPGFPGESAEDFAATMAFIKDCDLAALHVFPYSRRPNTRALRMPGHLPPEVIKERAQELRQLGSAQLLAYSRRFLGETLPVLWEQCDAVEHTLSGKTKNYLTVVSPPHPSHGQPFGISDALLKGFIAENKILAVPC